MNAATTAAASPDLVLVLRGAARWLGYLGFVLLVGTAFFLGWLWPPDHREPVLARVAVIGGVCSVLAVIGDALAGPGQDLAGTFSGRLGAAALARLALVSLALAFGRDVAASPRRYRVATALWALAMIMTHVVASDAIGGRWELVNVVATTAHLAATGVWLGGLLTLAAVLVRHHHLDVLHEVIPRFSGVAFASVVTLAVTGAVHAVAIAGSPTALVQSHYGAVLAVKVLVFGAMLVLGNVGRRYASKAADRPVAEIDDSAPEAGVRALAVAIGAEFALALAVLAVTAALVQAAPVT